MTQDASQVKLSLSRRRFLQNSAGGVAGLTAWLQAWPRLMAAPAAKDEPSGQMTWAMHVTIAPTWFDPAETPATITPFSLLYALHDAMCKPMPEHAMAPCLARQWTQSPDGLAYDFELREGVTFHNGDPFTAEDVQYSFERYKGAGNSLLKSKVKAVEIVDPHHVRFHLHEAWPDFMTFYGTPATGAAWIVPKHYTEKVGIDEFKKNPIGLGPYRVVEHQPGVELVLEANTKYWRKVPSVKRIVFKSVPEATTRLAMLKKREADVAYAIYGPLAEEVQRDSNLKLEPVVGQSVQWISIIDQYEPKSPWADKRVRLAASMAFNRQASNEAEMLGYSVLTGNIIPRKMEFALPLEPYPYDPKRAKELLKEAGYPNGFDAGECSTENVYAPVVEALVNDLGMVGIRAKVRALERAAMVAAQGEKRVKNLTRQGSGAYGNAATRIEAFMTSGGAQSFLKDAEIDKWYAEQATELDPRKREAILHRIQQKAYDEALFIPIFELGFLCASGPQVAVSGLGLIPGYIYSAPFEDVHLKA
jgi:peptide/nickel transport system substrate-binding protein